MEKKNDRPLQDKRRAVLTAITSAFRDAPYPYHESDITDEGKEIVDMLQQLIPDDITGLECVIEEHGNQFPALFEAFGDLLSFDSAEIRYVLPRLLVTLTFEGTHDIFDTRHMLFMLRGDRPSASVDSETILEADGPSGLQWFTEGINEVGQFNKAFLNRLHLDSAQVAAIVSWLEFMRESDELSDRIDEVNGAISFWKDPALAPRPH